ncbi:survival protein sure-like phosphatase/nucleotidase [Aspergillus cavernicola]|uniref:Survival protein sure-like phosphatase/nucleotidase n=1 Tax=Aspergillus cavernicola TaxID=176166 RepID=A0ABR4IGY7_9EURO
MHILVVNDDGPPSNESSPYIHSFVQTLQSAGHAVSVVLPHQQRSWIGKAHLIGAAVKPTYFRPGTLHNEDGTTHEYPRGSSAKDADDPEGDEWILINSTPASCVQVGLYHYFQDRGPVDLVVSGPNYGRNTTALFALSSGTIGAAMEGAACGRRSIALSYAFSSRNHDPVIIAEASRHSVRVVEHLAKNWGEGVDLYSVNVPLEPGVGESKIMYTDMLDNRWSSGSCFDAVDAEVPVEHPDQREQTLRDQEEKLEEDPTADVSAKPGKSRIPHKHFIWAPKFTDVYRSVEESSPGNDGWTVKEGMTSVTPLKANFMHTPGIKGEIKLSDNEESEPALYSIVDCDDPYVQELVQQALQSRLGGRCRAISSISDLPSPSTPVFQYREYERLDFEHAMMNPRTSLTNAYIIRKALIRKHYLSNTVANWVTKHPDSILATHVKVSVDFELDYAEFLDDALLEAYELRESLDKNESRPDSEKEWWILKPGMSDRGQGIRLFNSEDQLREIFEEWEVDSDDEDNDEDDDNNQNTSSGVITSQLRHFIAQPYIDLPLLFPSSNNRKFHIRTYVVAVGALKVYVFKEMLALFASKPYISPTSTENSDQNAIDDLTRHLTNTCFQDNTLPESETVRRFWDLDDDLPTPANTNINTNTKTNWKESTFTQICSITSSLFTAASSGMLIHFQTLPNAFEIFGVDFLLDETGKPWLLEVNAYPDFGQTGVELKERVLAGLFEGVVGVGVEGFFGSHSGNGQGGEGDGNGKEGEGDGGMRLVAELELGRGF